MRLLNEGLLLIVFAGVAAAHVGNTDVYLESNAGPYRLFITVRPPTVIPGVARIEVRSETTGVEEIRAVPLPLSGAGAKFTPVSDNLDAGQGDPQFFTASLWMMAAGSWRVRLTVKGTQGQGTLSVPVPMAALSTKGMRMGLGVMLAFLLVLLVASMVAIIGASVREGRLAKGTLPDGVNIRRGRGAMAIALAVLAGIVWLGRQWWDSTAADYEQRVYKPLQMKASLEPGNVVALRMTDPGWFKAADGRIGDALFARRMDDLIADHGHLMHLYAIREPGLDIVYHLHPEQTETGMFRLTLPTMQAGLYRLYADVVHETGFPETLVAAIEIPGIQGRALAGDDAEGDGWPWQRGTSATSFNLPDGYRMEWLRDDLPLRAKVPGIFRFRLLDPLGQPAHMALYMGMIGHAAFVKTDGTAFAHIHPSGSVSMAALALAQKEANGGSGWRQVSMGDGMRMPAMDHAAMPMTEALPNDAGFPYGFPSAGMYRIFVQMKHDETVETGIFDADVW